MCRRSFPGQTLHQAHELCIRFAASQGADADGHGKANEPCPSFSTTAERQFLANVVKADDAQVFW